MKGKRVQEPLKDEVKARKFLTKGRKGTHKGSELWIKHKELAPEAAIFPMYQAINIIKEGATGSFLATFRLGQDQALTTDSAGLVQSVFSNSPTSAQNWSSYAAVFDEYRVLAQIVKFEPLWATGGSSTIFWAPIARVVDRSDSTPLTSYALAERYDSHKKAPGQRKWKTSWNMNSIEEASFTSTTTSTANAWIKIYSSGNTISTTVGRMDIQYVVQFRGLGIN